MRNLGGYMILFLIAVLIFSRLRPLEVYETHSESVYAPPSQTIWGGGALHFTQCTKLNQSESGSGADTVIVIIIIVIIIALLFQAFADS